jgi:hypothetical protein
VGSIFELRNGNCYPLLYVYVFLWEYPGIQLLPPLTRELRRCRLPSVCVPRFDGYRWMHQPSVVGAGVDYFA